MIQKDDEEKRELAIAHYNDTVEALRAGRELPINVCEFRWLRGVLQVRHRAATYSAWGPWKDIPIVDEE